MIKRFWRWLTRPSGLAWSGIFLAGAAFAVIGLGGIHTALTSTQSTEFCVSCHEMTYAYEDLKKTAHHNNTSGVRAGCSDCHVPSSGWPYLNAKILASKDLYHHLLGTLDTPEAYEEHHLGMAQAVWTRMKDNDSRECRSCHTRDAMTISTQKEEAQKRHTEALKTGDTCIDCHKGIAHRLPDMKKAFDRAFNQLKSSAASSDLGNEAFTLETMPFYLGKGESKAAGQLLPATRLDLRNREGDWLQATVTGWRQEGAESVIYGAKGQRIISAVMAKATVEHAKAGTPEVVADTGQTWMPVSIDIWLPAENVAADITPVWEYASSLYQNDCATCHTAHTPGHFLANQWIGQLKSMERFSQLSKEQNRLVLKFLQYHAGDGMMASGH
ncbi:MAG: NapC/NirT family cytochrome c [Rhodospirillaceae bacterium]